MTFLEILAISVSLATDAFAVSICKGLSIKELKLRKICVIACYFGVFQAIMPMIGYCLTTKFERFINAGYSHLISFFLLSFIGINMIKEGMDNNNKISDLLDFKTMIILSIATSIDALAIGATMSFLHIAIIKPCLTIGIVTFIMSFVGVIIGNLFGDKYEKKAQIAGGLMLITIGTKLIM